MVPTVTIQMLAMRAFVTLILLEQIVFLVIMQFCVMEMELQRTKHAHHVTVIRARFLLTTSVPFADYSA